MKLIWFIEKWIDFEHFSYDKEDKTESKFSPRPRANPFSKDRLWAAMFLSAEATHLTAPVVLVTL